MLTFYRKSIVRYFSTTVLAFCEISFGVSQRPGQEPVVFCLIFLLIFEVLFFSSDDGLLWPSHRLEIRKEKLESG